MQFKNDLILLSQQVVDYSFMLYPTQISWLLCMWRSKHVNSNGKRTGSYTGIFYLSRQSTLYSMPHSPIHTNTVFYASSKCFLYSDERFREQLVVQHLTDGDWSSLSTS